MLGARRLGDRNKATFERMLAAVDDGTFVFADFFHPQFRDLQPSATRQTESSLATVFEQLRGAFPSVAHTIHHLLADGDLVAARVSATAVHQGPLHGIAATGREVTLLSTAVYRFCDGRIIERWCDHSPSVLDELRRDDG